LARHTGQRTLAIGPARRFAIYVVGSGLWLSGGLWLLYHYFIPGRGEFVLEPHPLESWWLRLHGAFAFGTIWIFGLLWSVHVNPGWAGGKRRRSGAVLVGLLLWLILSGYLLYYVGHERLRSVTSLLHWSLGLVSPVPFLLHRLASHGAHLPAEPAKRRRRRVTEDTHEVTLNT
jgi:hypothetical protein